MPGEQPRPDRQELKQHMAECLGDGAGTLGGFVEFCLEKS